MALVEEGGFAIPVHGKCENFGVPMPRGDVIELTGAIFMYT